MRPALLRRDEFPIRLVDHESDLVVPCELGELLDEGRRVDGARRVVGRDEQDRAGFWSDEGETVGGGGDEGRRETGERDCLNSQLSERHPGDSRQSLATRWASWERTRC